MSNGHDMTEQLEKRVSRLEESTTELLGSVARIESMVGSLTQSHGDVSRRINRPWQWGVVASAFIAIVMLYEMTNRHTDMAIAPVNLNIATLQNGINHLELGRVADDQRSRDVHVMLNGQLIAMQVKLGKQEESMAWMKLFESRHNQRMHDQRVLRLGQEN